MATGPKHPKRPRDLYQWAKRMVDIASGEVEDRGTGRRALVGCGHWRWGPSGSRLIDRGRRARYS